MVTECWIGKGRRAARRIIRALFQGALIVAFVLAGTPPRALAQGGSIDPDDLEAFVDELLAGQMAALNIPGVTLALVQNGQVLLAKGYGSANLEEQIPMHAEETVMRIGSVSKLFVATAVMQLVEQGRLDLHADVNAYLDTFQIDEKFGEPVTLAHLLAHTAGFGEHWHSTPNPDEVQPLGDYLAGHMPPRFVPPGEIISYSNHGYALAAYVVEGVTGCPFDRYVEDHILVPLGMEQSGYLLHLPLPEGLATGYVYQDGAYLPQPVHYDNDYPGGEMVSTAAGMARFMIAHLEGGCYQERCILQPGTVAEMHRRQFTHHPRLPGWTLGFQEEFLNGERAIGHSGAVRGFTSDLLLLPEHNLGYFVSFNHECSGPAAGFLSTLEKEFMDRYFPGEPAVPPASPEIELDRLTGNYRYTRYYRHTISKIVVLGADLSVTARDGRLVVRDGEYVPVGPLLFQEVGGKRRIAFERDGRGRIARLFWGPYAYDRLAWYESSAFHRLLFEGFGWVWGGIAGVGLLITLVRWRRRRLPEPLLMRCVYWSAALIFLLNAGFLISLDGFFWRSPATERAMLVLPLVSTALGAGVLISTAVMGWRKEGSIAGRLYGLLVALAAGLFAWFLNSWNLLGFHLG